VTGEEPGSVVHAQAADRDVGLDGARNAGEGLITWAGLVRLGQRALGVDLDERVDLVVGLLDARERGADQLSRRHVTTADEAGKLADRLEEQVVHDFGGAAYATWAPRGSISCWDVATLRRATTWHASET
jgi:hypothetical protein